MCWTKLDLCHLPIVHEREEAFVHSIFLSFFLDSFIACMVPTADFFAFGSDDTPNYTPRLSYVSN
jgi:hypothetical protein